MVAETKTNTAQNEGGIIIVGGGLAGLFCALKLAPLPVTILAAAPIGTGASSAWAQGGIAAAMSPGDSAAKHVADTLTAGAGIVDEEIALLMAREASDRIHDLLEYGVPFDKDLEGALKLSREAAHSERRIVRVRGDMAGKAIMTALIAAVEQSPSIKVLPGFVAEEIKKDPNTGVVSGVVARGQSGTAEQAYLFPTRALILASGGSGHLYQVTTNPAESRGGGMAMAARAGAMIADAEFVQFHPTAINVDKDPAPLATEALRGDGATLWNGNNERFMVDIHEDAELAPRDIVARGIFNEVQAGRGAFLDCTGAVGKHFPDEFPTVYGYCEQAGIDPVTERIPVTPAAHYHMGGVSVDANGRTSLSNLWACGEAASTGAHGANRLASNSLLEAVVFAHRIAMDIKETISVVQRQDFSALNGETVGEMEISDPAAYNLLRKTMSDCVGVVRTETGLRHALAVIQALENKVNVPRFQNMIIAAKLITASAFLRQESRGGHFRSDYPEAVEALAERSLITEKQATRVMQREARFDKSWLEKMQPEKATQEA